MVEPLCVLTADPLDARELEAAVAHPGAGAVLTFSGVARDDFEGQRVRALEYEAFPEMAVPKMREIAAEVTATWPDVRIAIAHRTGHLEIGEASVIIAVSAPHRDAAYQAGRVAIDELKARVPIWKKEIYQDGSSWKANAESGGDTP